MTLKEILERDLEIESKATPVKKHTVIRYEHGGGRVCVESENRKLVADFFNEPDREGFIHSRNTYRSRIEALKIAVEAIEYTIQDHRELKADAENADMREYHDDEQLYWNSKLTKIKTLLKEEDE